MSLRVSWVNIVAILLVMILVGCQKSPTGAVPVETPEEPAPKEVVVTSIPEPAPQPEPEPEPEQWVPENVIPREKETIVVPATKPPEVTFEDCADECASKCITKADIACGKSSGAECKQNCGTVIDPSACSTACSLRSAGICETKFIEFCSSKCEGQCH